MKTTEWTGCYQGGWKRGQIVPEAFSHPAKFAKKLIQRIVAFGLEQSFWKKGDLIGDPFGGVALGGLECAYAGLRWIGVELEPKFVALGQANIDLNRRKMEFVGAPLPVLLQGDSREFARIVGEVGGCVTSPPYAESVVGGNDAEATKRRLEKIAKEEPERLGPRSHSYAKSGKYAGNITAPDYGSSPGQIGALPAGDLDGVVSSPPWQDQEPSHAQGDPRRFGTGGQTYKESTYGATTGQIGKLPAGNLDAAVTSPPYASTLDHAPGNKHFDGQGTARHCGQIHVEQHGETAGNIGKLPVGELDGAVTSPPYEETDIAAKATRRSYGEDFKRTGKSPRALGEMENERYGSSPGQIGQERSETYWMAVRTVYEQVRLALRPNGVFACVVKDYVRDKARVPLCDQTATLLAAVGLPVFLRVRATLVETTTEDGFFGEVVIKKARKGFFRRLAEKKGSPSIDWEEIIWCRRES